MAIRTIQVQITGNAQGVQAASAQARQALAGVQGAAVSVGSVSTSAMSGLTSGSSLAATAIRRLRYEVAGLAVTVVGIQGVQNLARIADEYANMGARIRLVTRDSTEFEAVQRRLYSIAQATSAPLQGTVVLYSRMASAFKDLGGTQLQTLQLTETLNQAFAVSGATVQEQTASVIQLSQGLAAGALRGEEFNSVNEQAPRIMIAIADSLGVTRGELRKLAFDGKLTSQVIRDALSGEQAAKIAAEYSVLPITLGRAFTQLRNSFVKAFGEMDQATGLSSSLASALVSISENMEDIISAGVLMGEVLLIAFGSRLLYNSALYLASLVAQAQQYIINIALARQLGIAQSTGFLASLRSIGLVTAAIGTLGAALAGWAIGSYLREQFIEARIFGLAFVRGMLVGWESIKFGAQVAWEVVKTAATAAFDYVRGQLADLIGLYASFGEATDVLGVNEDVIARLRSMETAVRGNANANGGLLATLYSLNTQYAANVANIDVMIDDMVDYEIQSNLAAQAAAKASDDTDLLNRSLASGQGRARGMGEAMKFSKEQIKGFNDALKKDQQARDTAFEKTAAAMQRLNQLVSKQSAQLGGPAAAAALEYRDTLVDIMEAENALIESQSMTAEAAALITQGRANAFEEYQKQLKGLKEDNDEAGKSLIRLLEDIEDTPFNRLVKEIDLVGAALEEALKDGPSEWVDRLRSALGELNHAMVVGMVSSAQAGLQSLQSMSTEGSKAFAAMQVAIDALTVVQAISAILNQAQGDPYTAFARMAAMAAAVYQLVGSIGGSFGGANGFTDTAAQRQASQGTGTILGDDEAKSESAVNSLDITAKATTELVGINRGMLRALTALQTGLDSAGGMLARGAGQAEFTEIGGNFDFGSAFMGGFLSSVTNRVLDPLGILGGTSRVTDQGLRIGGGSLDNIDLGAFEEQQYRRWRFGSRRTRTEDVDLSGDLEAQFQLVIDSIVDTVREGALALGLLPSEVERALAAFQLEEIRISLKDLSAEEQQKELLAVFSSIFDGLAGNIVPFIANFQRVGEGLGETLVRVATGVQVMQEALGRLGFSLEATGPEQFAQISESLITLSGGIEEFISGMMSFTENFAPEAFKFELLQSDITRAFAQYNLVVPETREGMWDLMQSLDATTESGREQIAMLLRLSDTADEYYQELERAREEEISSIQEQISAILDYEAELQELRDELMESGMTPFAIQVRNINRWAEDAANGLNEAARAAGRQSAASEDLALVQQVAAQRMAQAIRELQEAGRSLVEQLFGSRLEQVEQEIAEIESANQGSTEGQIDAISEVGREAIRMYEQQLDAIRNIIAYLDSQLLSDVSTLTPEQRVAEAQRQFLATLALAQAGDVDALSRITQIADTFLQEGRSFYASGQGFTDIESLVRSSLLALTNMNLVRPPDVDTPVGPGGGGTTGTSSNLAALQEERQRLLDEQEAQRRAQLIAEIATVVRELIQATGDPLEEVAQTIGLNLIELAEMLGIQLDEATVETANSLVDLARSLGVEVAELATAVGFSLGELGDRQSLLNQALDETLLRIPEQFREQLAEPLAAIRNATTDADANSAIASLIALSRGFPTSVREQLAPFFAGLDPAQTITELGTLRTINSAAQQQLEVLRRILLTLQGVTGPLIDDGEQGSIRPITEYPVGPLPPVLPPAPVPPPAGGGAGSGQGQTAQASLEALLEVAARISRVEEATREAAERTSGEIRMLKSALESYQ